MEDNTSFYETESIVLRLLRHRFTYVMLYSDEINNLQGHQEIDVDAYLEGFADCLFILATRVRLPNS